ncbi:hypothetical protein L202_08122 [Cryptococcus amylolentus CBS 6039]|uniref:Uncharacterized protein n=2 Tax=Cryptococcus amylolentus TaxID=104669 RepID=A0A1E3H8Q2_9TREE|nr:hypothetical protein L202_08122 [Cryptococcus amylolentus CBS 6039]ODN72683.1 hypothetical protein L202_08122 [Cryptococcus amylolentus CBS 6039]ODN97893.1 hypothetical protein I350_07528 [Cryptococcus amylolentus CBS 6273]
MSLIASVSAPQYPAPAYLASPESPEIATQPPAYSGNVRSQYDLSLGLASWGVSTESIWIPLRPVEEEVDFERAQKLEEMIEIFRRTELKYAKRCTWAFCGVSLLVALMIVIAMVVSAR